MATTISHGLQLAVAVTQIDFTRMRYIIHLDKLEFDVLLVRCNRLSIPAVIASQSTDWRGNLLNRKNIAP